MRYRLVYFSTFAIENEDYSIEKGSEKLGKEVVAKAGMSQTGDVKEQSENQNEEQRGGLRVQPTRKRARSRPRV